MQPTLKTVVKIAMLFLLLIAGLTLITTLIVAQEDSSANYPHNPNAELEVISRLNEWRIHRGLNPLMRNEELDALAYQQAIYKAGSFPFVAKSDIHLDKYGEGVFERAQFADWASYDFPERILISEIAAYYPNIDGAFNFWQHSEIHTDSVTYAGFRELGIAVLEKKDWLIFYVVLGGRPEVLPVMFDPYRNRLYMTQDKSYYTDGFKPNRVQFLDVIGQRLHENEWFLWDDRMQLPDFIEHDDEIMVRVTDGISEITTRVNLYEARIYPDMPTPTATVVPSATAIIPTLTPLPPTATPTATLPPQNGQYDVTIFYNEESLSLVNTSTSPIDLTKITILDTYNNKKRNGAWMGQYAEIPITSIEPSHCVELWSFAFSHVPPSTTDACSVQVSARSILAISERFWLIKQFTIFYEGKLVASCEVNHRICGFDIPKSNSN